MRGNQTQSRGGTLPSARTSDVHSDRHESTHTVDAQSTASDDSLAIAFDELFALLGDEYVVDILQALSSDEMPARAIAEECDMSRPTVYRRLERLTEAGVVASRLHPESDGHHRQQFRLVLEGVAVQFREDGFDGRVRVCESASD
ncbi:MULTISPECIES: winged helix-turn-helix domain-containing protein [unclassified Haloarcula]|uniref:ArsR/SmtB family transcription factor n=1 Tax=unclassified Haloarcula TaxID=2624677 RepID=UPI0017847612|nr:MULTISPECIES: winged helix-turn-helix domain-containing protein [unclassified Haloarcula]